MYADRKHSRRRGWVSQWALHGICVSVLIPAALASTAVAAALPRQGAVITPPRDGRPHWTEPHWTEPHWTEPHWAEPHWAEPHWAEPHWAEPHWAQPSWESGG
jgi:hypothetical protein